METLANPMGGIAGSDDLVVVQSDRLAALFVGQSNALGLALVSGLSDPSFADPFPACRLIHRSADSVEDAGNNDYTDFGPDDLQSWSGTTMGPELSAGRDLVAQGGSWSIIKFAINGAALGDGTDGSVFHPNAVFPPTGDNTFEQVVDFTQANLASQDAGLRFVFWGQGEQDAATSLFAPQYAENLTAFLDELRVRLGVVPFLFTRLHPDSDAANTADVRALQDYFASVTPLVTLIDTDDLALFDDRHFDADSQVAIGERIAAAYAVTVQRTTMTVAVADSADPVTAGDEYSYSIVVTNTGANAAANVAVKIDLPEGAVYVGASGSGWNVEEYDDEIVIARRASGSVGAMPTLTITVAAPGSAGDAAAQVGVVASNVPTMATDSETTTIEATDTWTIDNGIAFPADAVEWGAILAAASAGGGPSHLHLCQEPSGDLVDVIGSWDLAPSGTVTYEQPVSGFVHVGVGFGGAAGDKFAAAGGPDPSSESVLRLVVLSLGPAPAAEATLFGMSSGFYTTHHTSGIPRSFVGASGGGNLGFAATGLQVLVVRHNRTAGTSDMFNAAHKASLTYDGGSVGTISGGLGGVDGIGFATPDDAVVMMDVTFKGAAAEKTDQQVFDLLDEMGFAPSWSP